jgi:cytochrome c peroxidase
MVKVTNSDRKTTVKTSFAVALAAVVSMSSFQHSASADDKFVAEAGHPSLRQFLLPATPPHPTDNAPTAERVELGKTLFFDPRLSATGQTSCASCHLPERGWSDGMPKSVRLFGEVMSRASPSIVNSAYNTIFLWDGRSPTLEHQALNGVSKSGSINAGANPPADGIASIQGVRGYLKAFKSAYPGEGISATSVSRALAAFERTIISNDSPFDRWVKGDGKALSVPQVRGFTLFLGKANCVACHSGPNFTDNGFHNVGLASGAAEGADPGRFKQRPVALMKGAFKTPTLRDVALTAPYFHDGSAQTLMEVVEHYDSGGTASPSLSPNMKPLGLSAAEKEDLVAFLRALTTPQQVYVYPVLPRE